MARCDCFDFPVSWDFYRSHCWEIHGFDPGNNLVPEAPFDSAQDKPRIVEHIHRYSNLGVKEFDLLQQTALKADHLEKQLNERGQPKKHGTKFEYKGIK